MPEKRSNTPDTELAVCEFNSSKFLLAKKNHLTNQFTVLSEHRNGVDAGEALRAVTSHSGARQSTRKNIVVKRSDRSFEIYKFVENNFGYFGTTPSEHNAKALLEAINERH